MGQGLYLPVWAEARHAWSMCRVRISVYPSRHECDVDREPNVYFRDATNCAGTTNM